MTKARCTDLKFALEFSRSSGQFVRTILISPPHVIYSMCVLGGIMGEPEEALTVPALAGLRSRFSVAALAAPFSVGGPDLH